MSARDTLEAVGTLLLLLAIFVLYLLGIIDELRVEERAGNQEE